MTIPSGLNTIRQDSYPETEKTGGSDMASDKRGYSGLNKHNKDIAQNVFSKDWATPLNADQSKDILGSPRQGGALEPRDLGMPGNPLGITGVGDGKKKK